METTEAFAGVRCLACDGQFDGTAASHRCPDCGGALKPTYDDLASAHATLFDGPLAGGADSAGSDPAAPTGLERFAPVLPIARDRLVTTGEGATPLVKCPTLAEAFGAGTVLLKDEGRNGTGGIADRGMALSVSAAREHGATDVALPTTGNGGQAAAAYAGRAGMDSHSFVPSRSTFANKALINVHGGDMNVVGGRYPDASSAFAGAIEGESWHSLAPFEEPYRHEGIKTLSYELVGALGNAPDAVVVPVAHGLSLVGIDRGFRELEATGQIEERPRLYAAQPDGCAPVVTAWESDSEGIDPVEHPDTICGSLEIADPTGGGYALDALAETGGGAVATPDDAILDAAVDLAGDGVPTSATAGAAVSGARALADAGGFASEETVVLVDPATANREADILRSHLMKQGI